MGRGINKIKDLDNRKLTLLIIHLFGEEVQFYVITILWLVFKSSCYARHIPAVAFTF
jgi:hypothetical protein